MGNFKSLLCSCNNNCCCRSCCFPQPEDASQAQPADNTAVPGQHTESQAQSEDKSIMPGQHSGSQAQPEGATTTSYQSVDLERLEMLIFKILQNAKQGSASYGEHYSSKWKMPESSDIHQLNEFLSAAADCASDLKTTLWGEHSEELNGVVKGVVKGIGNVHWITAGLLVVAFVLERFNLISSNKEDCLDLLDEMYRLCKYTRQATQIVGGQQQFSELLQESFELVVQGSLLCCAQRESGWLSKFMSASAQKERLGSLRAQLNKTYTHFMLQLELFTTKRSTQEGIRLPRQQLFPDFAVGIEQSITRVKQMLELESEKTVVAVSVYGLGGIGKTTLANAVYASITNEAFRFSRIVLFDNVDIQPNVTEKQKAILDQIVGKGTYAQPESDSEGRQMLRQVFHNRQCFLYIDNVLAGVVLSKLLPHDLHQCKRLRILLTARDASQTTSMPSSKYLKLFHMDPLQKELAVAVLARAMGNTAEDEESLAGLSYEDLEYVIKICGGMPLALEMVGRFMQSYSDKQTACRMIREEQQSSDGVCFGATNLDFYAFALKGLEPEKTEAFFDVCAFFQGHLWTVIENVFGEYAVQTLEKRGLIKRRPMLGVSYSEGDFELNLRVEPKDRYFVVVHDVLVEIAKKRKGDQGKRITTVEELTELLQCDDEKVLSSIKGTWLLEEAGLQDSIPKLPATKLDMMSASLRIFTDVSLKIEGQCKQGFPEIIFCSCISNETPFDISRCPKLRFLACQLSKPIDLSKMPKSIQGLRLNMRMLPEGVLPFDADSINSKDSFLPTLRDFRIQSLKYVCKLPDDILCTLKLLSSLRIDNCRKLSELPDEFKHLSYLRMLSISNCESLKQLPESLTDCVSLRVFTLEACSGIMHLPEGMGRLSSLESLALMNCKALRGLPEDIGGWTRLQAMTISKCEEMERLPRGFGDLSSLKILALDGCRNLKNLCEHLQSLSSLQMLALGGSTALEAECIDMVVKMQNLRIVDITGCRQLIERWEEIQDQHANVRFVY